jgi:flagellar protein FliS
VSLGTNNQYLEMKIQTATPEALVAMLYEGSIRFLNQALNALAAKDWHKAHGNIVRAQNIVSELNVSLDKQKGGEIAGNLGKIYGYINDRLVEANIKKDPKKISECISILSDLNSAWCEVVKNAKGSTAHGAGVRLAG